MSATSSPAIPGTPAAASSLPSGGLRLCLRDVGMLSQWVLSRRFRHAVEVRKHVWKILSFQRDELAPQAVGAVEDGIRDFDALLRSRPDRARLEGGLRDLETVAQKWLRPYASAAIRENVEVFLVAIGVAMAIRTFFLQPFKIPTGSMQPTLFGVHFQDLRGQSEQAIPGFFGRIGDALIEGDYYHEIIAEDDGEVVGVEPRRTMALIGYQDVVLRYAGPAGSRQKRHRIWFSPIDGHGGDLQRGLMGVIGRTEPFRPLYPGQTFKKGDVLLRLKDSAGDHLFVDRLTYNFRPPKRGEIVVFETRGIPGLQQDQFYIKRLVALGGETVQLGNDRHLIINRQRLDATTPHFGKVYSFEGPPADSQYSGHVNGSVFGSIGRNPDYARLFPNPRAEYTVGARRYMVMGDNTLNSLDSRVWGDFPQTNVVGKYCFVWWPFTGRWGTRPE